MGSLSQSTDCLRCLKMIIPLIGSLVIAVGCGVQGHPNLRIEPGPGCWNKPCKDAAFITSDIVVADKKLSNDKNSAEECQKLCNENKECKFFSFTHYANQGDCKLLSEDCVHETYDDPNHKSGPKDCEAIPSCPPITVPDDLASPESMFWTEKRGLVNPYKEDSPLKTKITTSCGGTQYTSECVKDKDDEKKGKWSTEGGVDPMKPDEDKSKCKCPELHFWYNPNDEPGAIFSCTDENTEIDDDFTLAPTDECVLICGIEVYKHIYCHDGKWNDVEDIQKGIGCFEYPEPNPDVPTTEDPDPTTTDVPDITTTEESEDTTTEESEDTTTEESEETTEKFFDY